jgi:hypothetical protein
MNLRTRTAVLHIAQSRFGDIAISYTYHPAEGMDFHDCLRFETDLGEHLQRLFVRKTDDHTPIPVTQGSATSDSFALPSVAVAEASRSLSAACEGSH